MRLGTWDLFNLILFIKVRLKTSFFYLTIINTYIFKYLNHSIIEFFPNGIFTSVGKYSNSVVELPVKKVDLGK